MEDLSTFVIDYHKYWLFIALMAVSFYIAIACSNLVKKLIGLSMFQISVFLFCIAIGRVTGAPAAIITEFDPQAIFSNPLPQVLILTAIVVSVATVAVGYSLIIRIKEAYETVNDLEIYQKNLEEQKLEEED